MESLEDRYKAFISNPNSPMLVYNHIAQGGSLTDLAETLDFPYHYLTSWIEGDKLLSEQFNRALKFRDEWAKETLLNHLRAISFVDIGNLYNEDGSIKNIKDIDKQTRLAMASFEEETIEVMGHSGRVKKIKMNDKLKAIDVLGKQLGVFHERIEHSGKVTLEKLVAESYEDDPPTKRVK